MTLTEKFLMLLFTLSVIFFFIFLYTADLMSTAKVVVIAGLIGIFVIIFFGTSHKLNAKN